MCVCVCVREREREREKERERERESESVRACVYVHVCVKTRLKSQCPETRGNIAAGRANDKGERRRRNRKTEAIC